MTDVDAADDQAVPSTRDALLQVAEEMASDSPWHEVTMAQLGKAAGVSRQTVYNEFGSKQGVAQAVALEVAGRVLDDVVAALDTRADVRGGLEAGLNAAFAHADSSPLVKAILTGTSGPDGLLMVVTTDAMPVLSLASAVVSEAVLARWPEVPADRAEMLVDSTIRLVFSHLLQPGPPREEVSAHIAHLVVAGL